MGFLGTMFRRRTSDSDVEKELRFHIEQQIDDYVRAGLSREEAARRTRLEFGGLRQVREECRDVRAVRWLEDAWRDVRYAIRMLARTPVFTAVAVGTLALGIGANTAIFSVVHALILKQLPYAADSDRLVRLMMTMPAAESPTRAPLRVSVSLSAAEMASLQAHARTLSKVGTAGRALLTLSGGDSGVRLQGARISSAVFQMLNAHPLRGRLFDTRDEMAGASSGIILSYATWQQIFHGDPDILDRAVTLATIVPPRAQRRYAVVGVMPQAFSFPDSQTPFWIPFEATPAGGGAPLRGPLLAQLADGVTPQMAAAEVIPIVRELRKQLPVVNGIQATSNTGTTYELVREHDELVAPVKPGLFVLTVAVGLVLLIACANVANLLLARTAARQREVAIRAAVGAGRSRLIRQALTESVLLALLGGAAAVVLALGGIRLLHALAATLPRSDLANGLTFPRLDEVGLDLPVLAFTTATSVATGLLFGLAPALRWSLFSPKDAATHRSQIRRLLVVAEIAMTMVLVVGSGLLIRSFVNLTAVPLGYNPANVLTFQVDLPRDRYPDDRLKRFADDVIAQLRLVPGVQFAASANQLPMVNIKDTAGGFWHTPDTTRGLTPVGDCRLVSRDYFKVMDIHVTSGRGFADSDDEGGPRVLLVNGLLARREFPGEDPIGRSVYIGKDPVPWQIVGIVEDVRQFGFDRDAEPQFFVDLRQWTSAMAVHVFPVGTYFAVRTDGDPTLAIANVRRIVNQLDPQASLFNVAPMQDLVSTTVARPRMYAVLLGIFAAVGVSLALIGIYGVMSYSVAQRTREIGVRMAVGAQPRDVLRLVLRQGMILFAVGAAIGIAGAAALARYLASMLFGLTPLDPATYLFAVILFAIVAFMSTYTPARRAARLDPAATLRIE